MNLKIVMILLAMSLSCAHRPAPSNQMVIDFEEQRLDILDEIQRSVLRISCSAYYDNFYYDEPKANETPALEKLLIKKESTTNSVAGSSLIIARNSSKILLLTCFHLFDFQDTIKTYYSGEQGFPTKNLLSLSQKKGQAIYVTHKNGARTVGIMIVNDSRNDLALIETETVDNPLVEDSFKGMFGNKQDIKFGRSIYLVGYPKGFLSVSRGLIGSSPYKNKFLIDAPFNRGFSGGTIIKINEKEKNYSYLGMANSMAYDSQLVLTPNQKEINIKYYENLPYVLDAFVTELKLVNVGLTFAISCSEIANFLNEEKEQLRLKGHDVLLDFK